MHLYLVATPIGNLDDITVRAAEVLRRVPVVLAEDTRRTRVLLAHLGARPKLLSYHHHTSPRQLTALLDFLLTGDVAIVTDAGTPAVSDPGGIFVAAAYAHFGDRVMITPIPGPSALTAALSIAGFSADRFFFAGFPPHKKGRSTFFDGLCRYGETAVFYESPHRIVKAMQAVAERVPERAVVVCRELTKKFETTYRGTAVELSTAFTRSPERGEYVVVLGPIRGPLDRFVVNP